MINIADNFLAIATQLFRYYQALGEKTFAQLSDEQLFDAPAPESNSIAVIVKHIAGNMQSRWTDFLHTDGEKSWRNRDNEFETADINSRQQLLDMWQSGWSCLYNALETIDSSQLETHIVYIRQEGHTIVEAVSRQIAHYAYHVGQIVYVGKMLKGEGWESLSIPKNKSAAYNQVKFEQQPTMGHFLADNRPPIIPQ